MERTEAISIEAVTEAAKEEQEMVKQSEIFAGELPLSGWHINGGGSDYYHVRNYAELEADDYNPLAYLTSSPILVKGLDLANKIVDALNQDSAAEQEAQKADGAKT